MKKIALIFLLISLILTQLTNLSAQNNAIVTTITPKVLIYPSSGFSYLDDPGRYFNIQLSNGGKSQVIAFVWGGDNGLQINESEPAPAVNKKANEKKKQVESRTERVGTHFMNIFLLILSLLLVLAGIAGSVIPALPGPPLSWVGLLLLNLAPYGDRSVTFLVVTAIVAALITVMDFVLPAISTKSHGGSKAGVWGCNIGLIISLIGLPFGPQGLLGIIFWPFVGALVGESLNRQNGQSPFRAAWGAFVGFLSGTFLKLAYALFIAFFVVKDAIF